jgi:hypothetical protein
MKGRGNDMLKILEVIKSQNGFLVFCTPSEKEMDGVASISIFDTNGEAVKITNFSLEHTRECFIGRPTHPWFKLDENIDERFLKQGNEVVFEL